MLSVANAKVIEWASVKAVMVSSSVRRLCTIISSASTNNK